MSIFNKSAYIFHQIAPVIQGTLLTFLPNTLVCFLNYNNFKPLENVPLQGQFEVKNSQKVNFS